MNNIVLSICIPVFNRENELKDCLSAIARNMTPGIEVVISDNASTDGTFKVIDEYSRILPIRWQVQDQNYGFDQNCVDVIAMANGEYCWILGSDDLVCDGSLIYMLNLIRVFKPDILHFGYTNIDKNNNLLNEIRVINNFSVISDENITSYVGNLQNLSLAFLFISCFIFNKHKWDENRAIIMEVIGTNYVHAYILHSILRKNVKILSSEKCLVNAGVSKNDWSLDPGRFIWMDAILLLDISIKLKIDILYFKSLCKIFRKTYTWLVILKICGAGGGAYICNSFRELTAIGYSRYIIKLLIIIDSIGVFIFIYKIYKFSIGIYFNKLYLLWDKVLWQLKK